MPRPAGRDRKRRHRGCRFDAARNRSSDRCRSARIACLHPVTTALSGPGAGKSHPCGRSRRLARLMFEWVLIANRGEIARRVIRTLDRLGIGSVAVYAPGDRRAPFVREGEHAVAIPSYLDIDAIVGACTQMGAQALHPGYGFLSENPALARACAEAGVTFIGPPA